MFWAKSVDTLVFKFIWRILVRVASGDFVFGTLIWTLSSPREWDTFCAQRLTVVVGWDSCQKYHSTCHSSQSNLEYVSKSVQGYTKVKIHSRFYKYPPPPTTFLFLSLQKFNYMCCIMDKVPQKKYDIKERQNGVVDTIFHPYTRQLCLRSCDNTSWKISLDKIKSSNIRM